MQIFGYFSFNIMKFLVLFLIYAKKVVTLHLKMKRGDYD